MSELKPCPFCGSEADADQLDGREWTARVYCCKCAATMEGPDMGTLMREWNRRAEPTAEAPQPTTTGDHIQVRITEVSHAKPSAVYEVAEPPERIYIVPGERDYYTSRHGSWLKGYQDALVEYVRKQPDKDPTRAQLADAARAYRDLCTCYRVGGRPTEKLFGRMSAANDVLAAYDKETP